MIFNVDYSLEGTDITYKVAEGHLIVESKGMIIRSAEKVTEGMNLNALALAMVDEAKEIMKQNGVEIK